MRSEFVRGAAAAAVAGWIAASALAQDRGSAACSGEISSALLGTLPGDAAYRVDLYDDSVENVRFRDAFLAALSRSGRRTADNGTLVVTFDAETYDAGAPTPAERTRGRLAPLADDMSSTGSDLDRLSNVEPRRRGGGPREQAHVNVLVRNQDTGHVVWTADVYCRALDGTRDQIVESILRAVIGVLGRTVARQPM
jgi:hypothetical protein